MTQPFLSAVFCEHANEMPARCPCPARCYCRRPNGPCRNEPIIGAGPPPGPPTLPPEFAPIPVELVQGNPVELFEAVRQHIHSREHRVYPRPRRDDGSIVFWCMRCGNTYVLPIESYRGWLKSAGAARPLISTLMSIILSDTDQGLTDWTPVIEAIDPVSIRPERPSVFDHLMSDDD